MSRPLTPVTIAVTVSLFFVAIALSVGAAIGGSYLLTLHAIHDAQTAQVAGALKECQALRALDQSHNGITFPQVNKAHPSEEALTRMFAGIHEVYASSGCSAILSGHTP